MRSNVRVAHVRLQNNQKSVLDPLVPSDPERVINPTSGDSLRLILVVSVLFRGSPNLPSSSTKSTGDSKTVETSLPKATSTVRVQLS